MPSELLCRRWGDGILETDDCLVLTDFGPVSLQASHFLLLHVMKQKQLCSSWCWYLLAMVLPGSLNLLELCFHTGETTTIFPILSEVVTK